MEKGDFWICPSGDDHARTKRFKGIPGECKGIMNKPKRCPGCNQCAETVMFLTTEDSGREILTCGYCHTKVRVNRCTEFFKYIGTSVPIGTS